MNSRSPLHAAAIDDELLLWDPESESLHRLNGSAAHVWRTLVGSNGADDVVPSAGLPRREFDACRASLEAEHLLGRTVTGRF